MKLFLTIITTFFLTLSFSQKEGNTWILGYPSSIPNDNFGGALMRFDEDSFTLEKFDIPFRFSPSAVISDSNGNLVAYSNSCDIANASHDIMPNGNTLNPGLIHQFYCDDQIGGYPLFEPIIILSSRGTSITHLFHLALNDNFEIKLLYETKIRLVNNVYEVVEKNNLILESEFSGRIGACRHGNGRDWWVVVPHATQGHFVGFYDSTGIQSMMHTGVGIYTDTAWDAGQSVFSPDGRIYARCDRKNQIQFMDFDRCSGTLSNARSLTMNIPLDSIGATGMAFSSDSRFMYVSTPFVLFQFDMHADDIQNSQLRVGIWDGGGGPRLSITFFQLLLAPDNKIYMTCPNGCTYLHVIHRPNEKGLGCGFEQRGVLLPVYHAYETPNIPNFRLGALHGSHCDSLFTSVEDDNGFPPLVITPNPASSSGFKIHSLKQSDILEIFNIQGSVIPFIRKDGFIQIQSHVKGLLQVRVVSEDGLVRVGKVVVN